MAQKRFVVVAALMTALMAQAARGQILGIGPCAPAPAGGIVLRGAIVDSVTGIRLGGATVFLSWRPPVDGQPRRTEAKAASDGSFAFCLPEGVIALRLSAEYEGSISAQQPLAGWSQDELRITLEAARSRLSGRVLDHLTGDPVRDATITLVGTQLVQTSRHDGRFAFSPLPVGRYVLRVRHVSFRDFADSVRLGAESNTEVTVRVVAGAIPLPALVVDVRSRHLDRVGFFERKARGTGEFLTRSQIEAKHPLTGTDVVRGVPGVRVLALRPGGARSITTGRGSCRFRYLVDGNRMGPDFEMDEIPPHWIEAVEIYRGPSEVPAQFSSWPRSLPAACGVILVWTREGR